MIPPLKRYYLMQLAYWIQQAFVMILGLEKPRSDYKELVMHHLVTLWLIGYVRLYPSLFLRGGGSHVHTEEATS